MKLASFNVNSLKARAEHIQRYLSEPGAPDILAVQETKTVDAKFPVALFNDLGYQVAFSGQPTYNGVALAVKQACGSLKNLVVGIPDFADEQKRVITAEIGELCVVGVYAVNGQAIGSEKFAYKQQFYKALQAYVGTLLASHPKLVLMGDFNIAPADIDTHDPILWHESILCSKYERAWLKQILALGMFDSFRALHPSQENTFSWWDYRMLGFQKNHGLRIDLVLLSEALRADLRSAGVDRHVRKWLQASDHAPVFVTLADA
jgi:exodeoxyribonuclease III